MHEDVVDVGFWKRRARLDLDGGVVGLLGAVLGGVDEEKERTWKLGDFWESFERSFRFDLH